jgi:hypothetical protein
VKPAHPLALDLHSRLLVGRGNGTVVLPVLGAVEWDTLVALIDLLLGIVWIGSTPELRRNCLAQVESDLGLPQKFARDSYAGLLIAAWMLRDWPNRVHRTVAELRVPGISEQLARWERLDPHVHEALGQLLHNWCPNELSQSQ